MPRSNTKIEPQLRFLSAINLVWRRKGKNWRKTNKNLININELNWERKSSGKKAFLFSPKPKLWITRRNEMRIRPINANKSKEQIIISRKPFKKSNNSHNATCCKTEPNRYLHVLNRATTENERPSGIQRFRFYFWCSFFVNFYMSFHFIFARMLFLSRMRLKCHISNVLYSGNSFIVRANRAH